MARRGYSRGVVVLSGRWEEVRDEVAEREGERDIRVEEVLRDPIGMRGGDNGLAPAHGEDLAGDSDRVDDGAVGHREAEDLCITEHRACLEIAGGAELAVDKEAVVGREREAPIGVLDSDQARGLFDRGVLVDDDASVRVRAVFDQVACAERRHEDVLAGLEDSAGAVLRKARIISIIAAGARDLERYEGPREAATR